MSILSEHVIGTKRAWGLFSLLCVLLSDLMHGLQVWRYSSPGSI